MTPSKETTKKLHTAKKLSKPKYKQTNKKPVPPNENCYPETELETVNFVRYNTTFAGSRVSKPLKSNESNNQSFLKILLLTHAYSVALDNKCMA